MINKQQKVLVSIPTYNERGNVEKLIQEINNFLPEGDILFIDDNSPDGTGKLLDELAESNLHLKVVHRPEKSGLGTAHKLGFSYARDHKYDCLITMDADFLHDPCYIPAMIEKSAATDIVIGSRYADGGSYSGINRLRKKLTYFWRWAIQKSLGLGFDATGSYRLYRVAILDPKIYNKISSTAFEFNMEAVYYFKNAGATISEVPIKARGRIYGSSKLSSKDMFAVAKKLFSLACKRIKS